MSQDSPNLRHGKRADRRRHLRAHYGGINPLEEMMTTYICLINLTDRGIRSIKDDPSRVKAAAQIAQSEGVRMLAEWWTMGPYDAVMIAEAPDDETMNRFLLGAGRQGNIRTLTMRAFTQDEIGGIIQKLA